MAESLSPGERIILMQELGKIQGSLGRLEERLNAHEQRLNSLDQKNKDTDLEKRASLTSYHDLQAEATKHRLSEEAAEKREHLRRREEAKAKRIEFRRSLSEKILMMFLGALVLTTGNYIMHKLGLSGSVAPVVHEPPR